MLYVSNNITPEMLPFDFDRYKSIEGKRVKFDQIKPLCNGYAGNIRMPASLGYWPRRIVAEGLRLDKSIDLCGRFVLQPGDDLLIIKYYGRLVERDEPLQPECF